MNNYRQWTNEKKTGYILDALGKENISDTLLESIQGWLASSDNEEEKDKQLREILDRIFEEYPAPGKRTYEMLAIAHRRLGLPELRIPAKRRIPLRKSLMFRVAAIIVPAMLIASAAFLMGDGRNVTGKEEYAWVSVSSDTGNGKQITLPDGSIVRLTGKTVMSYAKNFLDNRLVKLVGEAYFLVKKQEGRTFSVTTDKVKVNVVGTEFNLKAVPGDSLAIISLVKGKVTVEADGQNTELFPMEQLTYNRSTGMTSVGTFSPVLIDRWSVGIKELRDVTLSEALQTAGGFYGKNIVIHGQLPDTPRVTTLLMESESVEAFMHVLQFMSEAFEYKIKENIIYIYKKIKRSPLQSGKALFRKTDTGASNETRPPFQYLFRII